MAEYIKKWPVVDKLTALENELQQYKPFRPCEATMYKRICDIEIEIGKMDAEDVAPVRHGKWVHDINNLYGCSNCMERDTMSQKHLKNYCSNCGAEMDGVADA